MNHKSHNRQRRFAAIILLGTLLLVLALTWQWNKAGDSTEISNSSGTKFQDDSPISPKPNSNASATEAQIRDAYSILAKATKLPSNEVDSTGKRLPKKFEQYIEELKHGPQPFEQSLTDADQRGL